MSKQKVSTCKQCNVNAHNFVVVKDRKFIHSHFDDMTCMEIIHSQTGKELWRMGTAHGRKKLMVNYKHNIAKEVHKAVQSVLPAT